MSAELIIDTRELVGDVLLEMVVWLVPGPVMGSSHVFKYRLYAGLLNGTCLVRYDNERGKGDHRHIRGQEEPYQFTSLGRLKNDFMSDVFIMMKEIEP